MLRSVVTAALLVAALVACARDSTSIRLQVDQTLRSALDSFPAVNRVQAQLDVVCDNGGSGSVTQDVDVSGGFVDLENVPACGPASLTLSLLVDVGDGGPAITTFKGSATASLEPRVIIDVVFSGQLYGEIDLNPTLPTGGTCTIDDGSDPPMVVDVGAVVVAVPAPVGSYGITCTSPAAPDFVTTTVVSAATRTNVPIDLVPLTVNVQLAGITINGVPIGDFSAQKTSYRVVLPYATTSVTVIATSAQTDSIVTISDVPPSPGTTSFTSLLSVGPLPIDISVASADGSVSATYTVTVIRIGPNITAVAFIGDFAVEPPIDLASPGPFIVYYPASTPTAQVALTCDPDCSAASVTLGPTLLTGDGTYYGFGLDVGDNPLNVSTVGPDGNPSVYTFVVVRGGVTGLSCDVGALSPTFDPQTYSYDDIVASGTSNATCTAIASTHVVAAPITLTSVGSPSVMTVTTGQGLPLQQYTVTMQVAVTGTTILYDMNNDLNSLESGLCSAAGGRPTTSYVDGANGGWTLALSRPNTTDVFFLYPGLPSNILVRSVAADNSMPKRAVNPSPSVFTDYLSNVGGGGMGLSALVFNPTGNPLYGWSIDGFPYRLDVTAPFQDAPPGNGLPNGTAVQMSSVSEYTGSAVLGVTSDQGWLVAVGIGAGDPNVFAYGLNPTGGTENGVVNSIATGTVMNLAAFSYDGNLIFGGTGTQLVAEVMSYSGSSAINGSAIPLQPTKIVAHPSANVIFVLQSGGYGSFAYDPAMGILTPGTNLSPVGATTHDMGISSDGTLLWVTYTDSGGCKLAFHTVDSAGTIALGLTQPADCQAMRYGLALP